MADLPATPTITNAADIVDSDRNVAGKAQEQEGVSLETFLASLAVSAIVFGVEFLIFIVLRRKLKRVYEPRTYLVPEKKRMEPPSGGLLAWIKPIFATSNKQFIAKSGLDAYFFLRYLYMLIRIFLLLALPTLPILLPLNSIGGRNGEVVKGLDRLSWTNIKPDNTSRYWAHLLIAVYLVVACCYMFYRELRVYVRLRQQYLTSPEHRLRASATTVLVAGIPRKWLTVEKLMGLYDVFPGGLRNIWINRDYDDLAEKVKERDDLARRLERAETNLIQMCKKAHAKKMKAEGRKVDSEKNPVTELGPGISGGNPHQIPDSGSGQLHPEKKSRIKRFVPIPLVGDGLEKFTNVAGNVVGKTVDIAGKTVGAVKNQVDDFTNAPDSSYVADDRAYSRPTLQPVTSNSSSTNTKRGSTLMAYQNPVQPSASGYSSNSNETAVEGGRVVEKTEVGRTVTPEPHQVSGGGKMGEKVKSIFGHGKRPSDERPITELSPTTPTTSKPYEKPYNREYDYDEDPEKTEPVWKQYIKETDRETMRLPIFGLKWMPSLPLIGKKVDTIWHCRRELARLNVEIEEDQQHPERFPLMNSAFIQFNSQMAAHMACQSVSHHVPEFMTPRHVEVSPDDVIWDNMRIKWWERYMRTALVTVMTGGLIIGWAFPVAFVGLVSQVNYLKDSVPFLAWLDKLPNEVLGFISGVLPPLGLAILMAILPIILRMFARIQGMHTGMAVESTVQGMYFAFLFIQVFLVVSISSGITTVIDRLFDNPARAPEILAQNLPKASNFFFSYLMLQGFAVSGGALLQIGVLLTNYILARFLDVTAREKWTRQTNLVQVKWGTFFPIYTNLACIGIIYSVISPLILIFNIFTFSLFWVVYRYNLLFVNNYRFDTGGILFPRAVNQLFTGIYIMEVCLVGLFFLVRDADGNVACFPQAIIMIIVAIATVVYQYTLNKSFGALYTYLPITLEDDAVERDRLFAAKNQRRLNGIESDDDDDGEDLNEHLRQKERAERAADRQAEETEMREIRKSREAAGRPSNDFSPRNIVSRFHRNRHSTTTENPDHHQPTSSEKAKAKKKLVHPNDLESQTPNSALQRQQTMLFDHLATSLDLLSPEERDSLVGRAFQHEALRSKRPAIWIPRDDLGVSDDEVRRAMRFSGNIWYSNEFCALDGRGRVVYGKTPPDFDVRDLIEL